MKTLIAFIAPTIKSIGSVVVFLIGLGFSAYGSIYLIVKAEGQEIRREVKTIRDIDMDHMNKRFDRIERLIRETR